MATALHIQPEAFAFEAEFDEYEGGPQARATPACPPYQRGEVEKSKTAQGQLPADVIQHAEGQLIADFGVDWRHTKPGLARDPALRAWLNTMIDVVRANPDTKIWIKGYSDCVGRENNNQFLRRGRALRVRQLLRQLAGPQWSLLQPKIVFTGAAPAGEYVADNGTVEGRAQNRGVLIKHERIVNMEPVPVTVRAPVGPCSFRPSRHGFKFANYFTLPSSITDPLSRLGIPIGAGAYGLCGGMSFLAADFFSFHTAIPSTTTVPPLGSALYIKLLGRQLDSLKLRPLPTVSIPPVPIPVPLPPPGFAAPVIKFWRWMGLPDRGRGSVAEKTTAEIAVINRTLRRRKFAVFGLVLVDRSGSLTDNHQVLAFCMTQPAADQFVYAIYDPNHPLGDDVRIEVQIIGGEARTFHVAGGSRTPVRGFFNMPYTPKPI